MKKIVLFALLISAVAANAQTSLKDALYGGKLKTDSGTVIRKGEDLSTKIDTSTRKPVEVTKVIVRDSSGMALAIAADSAVAGINSATANIDSAAGAANVPVANATKDNNKVWKDFMDELTTTLRTEVMTSKKIKAGTYSVLIDYEIDTDGQVNLKNVSSSPENSFLEDQVRQRITLNAPQLTPLLNTYGKPRKAPKKYTLTLSK